jgi:hypothetical protein
MAAACARREIVATREALRGGWGVTSQPESREGQAGPFGVADGSVRAGKLGNAGRAKGPWFKTTQEVAKDKEIGS